jgi:hypothetical protein
MLIYVYLTVTGVDHGDCVTLISNLFRALCSIYHPVLVSLYLDRYPSYGVLNIFPFLFYSFSKSLDDFDGFQ